MGEFAGLVERDADEYDYAVERVDSTMDGAPLLSEIERPFRKPYKYDKYGHVIPDARANIHKSDERRTFVKAICAMCGIEFETDGRIKYCGGNCRKRHDIQSSRERYEMIKFGGHFHEITGEFIPGDGGEKP